MMGAPLSIRQFASIVFPSGVRDGRLLMLKAYFDDAGTHASAPVVVMGGLVGTVEQWDALECGATIRMRIPRQSG